MRRLLTLLLVLSLLSVTPSQALPRQTVELAGTIIELEQRIIERGRALPGEADDLDARLERLGSMIREDRLELQPELVAFLVRGYGLLYRISTELAAHAAEKELYFRKQLGGEEKDYVRKEIGGTTVVLRGDPTSKEIALTFDDGPSPNDGHGGGTEALLDYLAAEDILATFFLCGEPAVQRPDLVKRVIEDGHAIGNHTRSHARPRGLMPLTDEQALDEIVLGELQILRSLGTDEPLIFFRCPYGNGVRSPRINRMLADNGYFNIYWTIDTNDWKTRDSQTTVSRVLNNRKLDGAIVLMHDRIRGTVDAVKTIVDTLRPKGYRFVSIPQLLGVDNEGPTRLAYRDASGLYMAGDKVGAMKLLASLAEEEPDSLLADDSLHHAWIIAREIEDSERAAKYQEALRARYPQSLFVKTQISLKPADLKVGLRSE